MKLKELLKGIDYEILSGNIDEDICCVQYDSRKISVGDVFFCIQGYSVDGHNFIDSALLKGAKVIVCEKNINIDTDCTVIKVADGRKALAIGASNYYGRPSSKLKIIGITGTNGKTTSAFMIKHVLEAAGFKVGLLGTIANYIGNKRIQAQRTTPESLELHGLFKEMVDAGVDYCVMEVSSHSLYLDRVYGINFSQGIFTNLTQDHLDFHKTFENYYNAKLILFNNSLNSIINIDDEYGRRVFEDVKCNKITYSIENKGDIVAENISMHSRGIDFDMVFKDNKTNISLNIPGRYNIMNALGSAAACLNEGIDLNIVKKGLETMECVPGRCEIVSKKHNLDFEIIVDYAHTPDGLKNILKTAREFTKGKLISVFGCGGDRDRTKRPIMGKIGTDLCDLVIITSDNPRSEEPSSIIADITAGINKNNYKVVENRKEAIKKAIESAKKDDVIVIAGKGHEDYQVLKDKTIHFDEREVIEEIINGDN